MKILVAATACTVLSFYSIGQSQIKSESNGINFGSSNHDLQIKDPSNNVSLKMINDPNQNQGMLLKLNQNGNFQFNLQTQNNLLFKTGGQEYMRLTPGGNFGIGTTSPAYPLSVNGTIQSLNGGFMFPDGSVQTTAAGQFVQLGSQSNPFTEMYVNNFIKVGTNSLWLNSGAGGDNQIYTTTGPLEINPTGVSVGGGPSSIGENTLINPQTGLVGIGLPTDLQAKLHLNHNADLDGGVQCMLIETSGTTPNNAEIGFRSTTGDNDLLFYKTGSSTISSTNLDALMRFGTDVNGSTMMYQDRSTGTAKTRFNINGHGHVGIATINPTAKLDLALSQANFAEAGVRVTAPSIFFGSTTVPYITSPKLLHIRSIAASSAGHVDHMVVQSNGKVGFGTDSPQDRVDFRMGDHEQIVIQSKVADTYTGFSFRHSDGSENWRIRSFSDFSGGYDNTLGIIAEDGGDFWISANKTLIGGDFDFDACGDCDDYKLFVKKGIRTEQVKVDLAAGVWADYVFEEDYKLISLSETEKFVEENKHLPGVPSAKELEKEGINMAKMDAKLMEKIEELYLHVFEMNKKLEQLQNENDKLKKDLETNFK